MPHHHKNPTQPFPDLSSKKKYQKCSCKFLVSGTFWLWGSYLLAILSSMRSSSGTLKVASQISNQRGNSECLQPKQQNVFFASLMPDILKVWSHQHEQKQTSKTTQLWNLGTRPRILFDIYSLSWESRSKPLKNNVHVKGHQTCEVFSDPKVEDTRTKLTHNVANHPSALFVSLINFVESTVATFIHR